MPHELVVKQLPPGFEREADVYEVLWRYLDSPPIVRMLGREVAEQTTYLYLEKAQTSVSWPWTDTQFAGAVCRALARLHDSHVLPREAFAWNYETELTRSARSTLDMAEGARDVSGRRLWRRPGDLRRLVAALPQIRQRLLSGTPSVIHGDMHPGNVILRGDRNREVVLIDWARARLGSPLEDVASWLHSLGCWEPEARRRHDTLMRVYLDARCTRQRFAAHMRVDYWLASASNGLAGAIRYHLAVLSEQATPEAARYDSERALVAWQRVVRRAAALLSTSLDR
jgi:aminoglycoside phosphotransferase (APT) family kinase protein